MDKEPLKISEDIQAAPEGCDRCGQCCEKGGPALHQDDLAIVLEEKCLDLSDLCTIRQGEMVWDQPEGKFLSLAAEMVKIKPGPEGTACKFFDKTDKSCSIYRRRPLECRLLLCKDDSHLRNAYREERITRSDLLPKGHPVTELICEHEELCRAGKIAAIAEELAATGRSKDIGYLAKAYDFDKNIRAATTEKTGLDIEDMDFFFGRPVSRLLAQWGIDISTGKTGSIKIRMDKK